jgi:hypothetical protein
MTTYKLQKSFDGAVRHVLRDVKDCIPFDPANTDYQEFLRWCEEGNTPLPAEE